jgi:heat shock protein HtpX
MERRFGRDPGLSVRIALTGLLLLLLYLPFAAWVVGVLWLVSSSLLVAGAAVLGAVALAALGPALSERVALRAVGAEIVSAEREPRIVGLVERLAALADVPPPRVAVAELDAPNAFTAGRRPGSAVVVVTRGLVSRLDERELDAVLAHELAHAVHRDAFVMTIAAAPAVLARRVLWAVAGLPFRARSAPAAIAGALALLYLVPLVLLGWFVYCLAVLLVMTLSRYREHAADRVGALLTGAPEQLMSALQKIDGELVRIPQRDLRQVTAVNALCVLPAGYRPGGFEVDPLRLFPTHPPLADRLARLGALARTMALPDRPVADSGAPPRPEVARRGRPRNPHAAFALLLALVFWTVLGLAWITRPDGDEDAIVLYPLVGAAALIGGVLLALQGIGRASAGAAGMAPAASALALLLGPPAVGFVAMAAYLALVAL